MNKGITKWPAIVCGMIGLICILFAQLAEARDWKLMELKEASATYKDFFPGGSDPLITQNGLPNRTLGQEVALNLNVDLLQVLYFNNRVHGGTDEIKSADGLTTGRGQFRTVGWEFELGVRISDYINISYYHHSQHILDYDPGRRFPVQDALQLKIFFFRDQRPSGSIF